MRDCRYFETCSAPLCPKDDGAGVCAWFPDEDACRCSDAPEWVKRQRRISRKAAAGFCFTVAMLAHDCRISKNLKGIDPDGSDHERETAIQMWLAAHPVITAEEREKKRLVGVRNLAGSLGAGALKTTPHWGLNAQSGGTGSFIPAVYEPA
jgi:hypothetical protein